MHYFYGQPVSLVAVPDKIDVAVVDDNVEAVFDQR